MKIFKTVYIITILVLVPVTMSRPQGIETTNSQKIVDLDNQIKQQEYTINELRDQLKKAKKTMDSIPDQNTSPYNDAKKKYLNTQTALYLSEMKLQRLKDDRSRLLNQPILEISKLKRV